MNWREAIAEQNEEGVLVHCDESLEVCRLVILDAPRRLTWLLLVLWVVLCVAVRV